MVMMIYMVYTASLIFGLANKEDRATMGRLRLFSEIPRNEIPVHQSLCSIVFGHRRDRLRRNARMEECRQRFSPGGGIC